MLKAIYTCLLLLTTSCACGRVDVVDQRSPNRPSNQELDARVLELTGVVAQLQAFLASDYTDCAVTLPAFERKLCQVAQTATAEQRVLLTARLSEMAKTFQTAIYGDDCTAAIAPGCPAPGSILAQGNAAAGQITALSTSIQALDTRLTTAEAAIAAIDSTLITLNGRVQVLEAAFATASIYTAIDMCADVTPTVGPLFEVLLLQGDRSRLVAYIEAGGNRGLGVVRQAGAGDLVIESTLSTLKCRAKIYDAVGGLRICWLKGNRMPAEAALDAACGGGLTPNLTCTCK